MHPPPGRTAIYRIYDRQVRLLYIGIARWPENRIQRHNQKADWWPIATHQSIDWRETRVEAECDEERVVRREGPLYNSVYGDLFDGSAQDARDAIPPHLERVPSHWAWGYVRRQPPMPLRLKLQRLNGVVERLSKAQAAVGAEHVLAFRPDDAETWASEYAGVPKPWGNHAIVAYALRRGAIKADALRAG